MDADHGNNGIWLPYDLHLDILRRLPGRDLAVSRSVCRRWSYIVDAHALLLPHVFPREFPGIFARYRGYHPNLAFIGPQLQGEADADEPAYRRLFGDYYSDCCLKQHCNGLLLFTGHYTHRYNSSMDLYVCNPATSRYARLPLPLTPWSCSAEGVFLAFDPAVSRHHEVFFFRTGKLQREEEQHESSGAKGPSWIDSEHESSLRSLFGEDQPSESEEERHESHAEEEKLFHVLVFSSRTGQWERREFTPGRSASGDLYDVVTAPRAKYDRTWWSAEYWRGSLYVHCHSGILMILRCAQKTYDIIQLPRQGHERLHQWELPTRYLASNERGICYVMLTKLKLEVWELSESGDDRLGWTLTHEADLKEYDRKTNYLMGMQLRVQWEVVQSSKDLLNLFKHNSDDQSKDDCDDETLEDEYEEGENEEEEEVEEEGEEEKDNNDNIEYEEEEEHDCDDETRGEENEEQHSNHDYEDEELESTYSSDYSWNSDQDNFIEFDNNTIPGEEFFGWGCWIVGYHPYKDVLLLKFSDALVAYHLHTSRMQCLANIYPHNLDQQASDIIAAFPYRPCYVDALPSRTSSPSS